MKSAASGFTSTSYFWVLCLVLSRINGFSNKVFQLKYRTGLGGRILMSVPEVVETALPARVVKNFVNTLQDPGLAFQAAQTEINRIFLILLYAPLNRKIVFILHPIALFLSILLLKAMWPTIIGGVSDATNSVKRLGLKLRDICVKLIDNLSSFANSSGANIVNKSQTLKEKLLQDKNIVTTVKQSDSSLMKTRTNIELPKSKIFPSIDKTKLNDSPIFPSNDKNIIAKKEIIETEKEIEKKKAAEVDRLLKGAERVQELIEKIELAEKATDIARLMEEVKLIQNIKEEIIEADAKFKSEGSTVSTTNAGDEMRMMIEKEQARLFLNRYKLGSEIVDLPSSQSESKTSTVESTKVTTAMIEEPTNVAIIKEEDFKENMMNKDIEPTNVTIIKEEEVSKDDMMNKDKDIDDIVFADSALSIQDVEEPSIEVSEITEELPSITPTMSQIPVEVDSTPETPVVVTFEDTANYELITENSVIEKSSVDAAIVTAALLGFKVGGVTGAFLGAASASFIGKKETQTGGVVRVVGKTALGTVNLIGLVDDKFEVSRSVENALISAVASDETNRNKIEKSYRDTKSTIATTIPIGANVIISSLEVTDAVLEKAEELELLKFPLLTSDSSIKRIASTVEKK